MKREIVTERPMSSARAFHILTLRMKKYLWYVVVLLVLEQIELHLYCY